jgi:predicted nuclease of predicted toxin-antitoxin system
VIFLVDQQLPPALCRFFEDRGHVSYHVRDLGLNSASDAIIERHASANKMVVVSKDEDFFISASRPGSDIQLVWVRIGNCRTDFLLERFRLSLPQIVTGFEDGSNIVELW